MAGGHLACSEHVPNALNASSADAAGAISPGATDASPPPPDLAWTPCFEVAECGTVRVPVDPSHPGEGEETLDVQLLRVRASSPTSRIGTLIVHRGGPGAPMVDELGKNLLKYRLGFADVFERFDVVVFDWRGTGRSGPIPAVTTAFMERFRKLPFGSSAEADRAVVDAARVELVAGFEAHASRTLLEHLDSVAAARDVELVRQALGEDRISLLGMSHGTRLALTYAALYPERVDAIVLDAPVTPVADLSLAVLARISSVRTALDRFFDTCEQDVSCTFHGGAPRQEIEAAFDALRLSSASREGGLPAGSRTLSPFEADAAIVAALADGRVASFASDLHAAETGDASALLARADAVFGRSTAGDYDGAFPPTLAITCHETPLAEGTTVASFGAFVDAQPGARREVELGSAPYALCAGWPWRAEFFDPVKVPSGRPTLVLASAYDPSVGMNAAQALTRSLGSSARSLVYEGGGHVAALHSACARHAIGAFLASAKADLPLRCAAE